MGISYIQHGISHILRNILKVTLDGGQGHPPGRTALMIAAKNKSDKVVSSLLELMANVDIISPGRESALSYALISQDTEIVDKVCHHTNTCHGFEEVCRILSLNRVKITGALMEYIKRTRIEDWNEENAAWICGVKVG